MANKPIDLSHQQQTRFRGFTSPRYTPVPDELFDELMSLLSGAELKVVLYIIRRTFGFKKESEAISLSQIRRGITTRDGRVLDRGTGLSLSAAQAAIKGLVEKRIVVATRNRSAHKGDEATTYRLHIPEPGGRSEGRTQMDEQSTILRPDTHGGAGTEPDDASATAHLTPVTENQQGRGIPKIGEGGYRKSATQETVSQQTALAFRSSKAAQGERERQEPGDAGETGDGERSKDHAPTIAEEPKRYAHATSQLPVRSGGLRSLAEVLAGRQGREQKMAAEEKPTAPAPSATPTTPALYVTARPAQATARGVNQDGPTVAHPSGADGVAGAHKQPTPQIIAVITEISQEFGDHHHLRSNFTQAMRVWEASGRGEAVFVGTLFEARSITRQQPRVSHRMPYFWSVLRDLLGLRPQELPAALVAPH